MRVGGGGQFSPSLSLFSQLQVDSGVITRCYPDDQLMHRVSDRFVQQPRRQPAARGFCRLRRSLVTRSDSPRCARFADASWCICTYTWMCVLRATTASSKSLRSCFRPEAGASRWRGNADALPGIASTRLDTQLAAGSDGGCCVNHSNTHCASEGGRRWPIKPLAEPLLPIAGRLGCHHQVLSRRPIDAPGF